MTVGHQKDQEQGDALAGSILSVGNGRGSLLQGESTLTSERDVFAAVDLPLELHEQRVDVVFVDVRVADDVDELPCSEIAHLCEEPREEAV